MKKRLLIFFLLTAPGIGFAQNFSFGIKGGLNLANQSFNEENTPYDKRALPAFNAGVIAEADFNSFTVQSGLFYSVKGDEVPNYLVYASQFSSAPPSPTTSKYILNYIELPVNFLFKTPLSKSAILRFGGGPYFGYGVSAKISGSGPITSATFGSVTRSFEVNYKNPEYGVNFIAGIKIKNRFLIDAGYGLGLTNLASTGFAWQSGERVENRVMSFSIGYLFK